MFTVSGNVLARRLVLCSNTFLSQAANRHPFRYAGGQFTGGSPLDIARLFATSVVFKCSWRWTGVFLSAHLTAGLLAAAWTLWAFGKGDHFKRESARISFFHDLDT
eukprot:1156605-Pelagomonas_calceolata.AAC.7